MPLANPYGFWFEERGEPPGHTLRADLGPSGSTVLAQQVADEIARVEGSVIGGIDTRVSALEALGLDGNEVRRLGTINFGAGTNSTEFSGIDQTFRDLMILWRGASDGSGEIDSLALRFNADGGDNYHSRLTRNLAAGGFMDTDGAGSNYTFSILRAGYVGTLSSAGVIFIPSYRQSSVQRYAFGTNAAVGQSGLTNIFAVTAGGRWTGTAPVTSIRIWPSGQLWSGTPHITLIGIR
jgi:hypothetical protein